MGTITTTQGTAREAAAARVAVVGPVLEADTYAADGAHLARERVRASCHGHALRMAEARVHALASDGLVVEVMPPRP